MKKRKCLVLLCSLLILLISGCLMKPDLSLLKIEEETAPTAVRNFVREQSGRNGVDLYSDGVHGDYLFLNAYNVVHGEKAAYFTDVSCKINNGILCIYFSEKLTEEYSERMNNKAIYKIESVTKYHTIRVFKNGEEISFDVVGA